MKNTNTKTVKGKSKKSSNKKVAVAKVAPVTQTETPVETKATQIQVEVTPVSPVVVNQTKRGRGRPSGSSSLSLVNLQDLVNALPANIQIPLSNRVLRSMNNLGLKINSSPFKASTGFGEVVKALKPSSGVAVIDLNKETVKA